LDHTISFLKAIRKIKNRVILSSTLKDFFKFEEVLCKNEKQGKIFALKKTFEIWMEKRIQKRAL
jgi:hypothetical protein